MDYSATKVTILNADIASPFEDPTPSLVIPESASSSSETNPFRARNPSANSNMSTTPILDAFPVTPTSPVVAVPTSSTSPRKSKNPFLDISAAENTMEKKDPTSPIKESSRKYPSTNGSSRSAHPRTARKPDDPNAPRPSSSSRKRDPNKSTSDRDKERDRHKERRDRPTTDPSRRPRPRSNSESSVPNADKAHRLRKEEGHIHKSKSKKEKDDKSGDGKKSSSSKRRLHPVDKIDLLDVTGLYGSHGFFHHDGPFDACRPHRNKQPHKAPVAAFPANSITNTLAGGLGEVPGLDRDQYFGLPQNEAFQDYGVVPAKSRSRRGSDPQDRPSVRVISDGDERLKIRPTVGYRSTSFDPRLKTEPVHGEESAGLGTSTFLEGAPAPKSAIEKAAKEDESEMNGLTRKKSLVQKIKGRRATGVGDRSPPPLASPLIVSPNGSSAALVDTPYNPFTKEGQFIERVESLDSTKASRERADSGGSDKGNPGGGLLGRVKSLKISGGRKQS